MKWFLSKYVNKLYFKKWIIGIYEGNIKDIIITKTFDPEINWVPLKSLKKFHADPFILTSEDSKYKVVVEDYTYKDDYGKIALVTLDKNFTQIGYKILLDTKSHLSYPCVFKENNKTYVFPEAGKSGKLLCYEYDPLNESLNFIKNILHLPLLDGTILKHDNKYWIFGALTENYKNYELSVFFSNDLLGPYSPHPGNPIRKGLDNIRSAGNFIEVDGVFYRPTQNCKDEYGKSIVINKICEFNENKIVEENYMTISINKNNKRNHNIYNIHTINATDNIIVIDGMLWTFSPLKQLKKFISNF